MFSSISVVLVLRHSLKIIAPSSDMELCDIFSFCSAVFSCMASAIILTPLYVIQVPDMFSSISVVLILRHSLKAIIAPSSDMELCKKFRVFSVVFSCMASAITLASLTCDMIP